MLLFGRLRLGAAQAHDHRPAPASRRATGRRIDTLKLDGRSSFTRTIAHVPGSLYRLGYPRPDGQRKTSIAIKPVPAAR